MQQLLESVTKKAKKDAIKCQKVMVLYSLPDGTPSYMEQEAAELNGITPLGYISQYTPTPNG